jgi:hypothetical protein
VSDALDRLKAALADRYTIERELGQGGMATVYLAEDLKHHRPVALEVLKPELSAVLGPERFLREIELSARLTHPHILPLQHGDPVPTLGIASSPPLSGVWTVSAIRHFAGLWALPDTEGFRGSRLAY